MATLARHFRCSIANTASMIGMVTSAVRDTITNAMLTMKLKRDRDQQQRLPDFLLPQQRDGGIGQRYRAEREFLALVDVVLDEDAALGVGVLERESGIESTSQDIAISSTHETRKATNTHMPRVERSK